MIPTTPEEWWALLDKYNRQLYRLVFVHNMSNVDRYDQAVLDRDHAVAALMLQGTWSNLPDHKSTRSLPGFSQLCTLCSEYGDCFKDIYEFSDAT